MPRGLNAIRVAGLKNHLEKLGADYDKFIRLVTDTDRDEFGEPYTKTRKAKILHTTLVSYLKWETVYKEELKAGGNHE